MKKKQPQYWTIRVTYNSLKEANSAFKLLDTLSEQTTIKIQEWCFEKGRVSSFCPKVRK